MSPRIKILASPLLGPLRIFTHATPMAAIGEKYKVRKEYGKICNEFLIDYSKQHIRMRNNIDCICHRTCHQKLNLMLLMISRARKIVTKFHNYSYEIVMSPVIVNSYKNAHNSYQIVK